MTIELHRDTFRELRSAAQDAKRRWKAAAQVLHVT